MTDLRPIVYLLGSVLLLLPLFPAGLHLGLKNSLKIYFIKIIFLKQ